MKVVWHVDDLKIWHASAYKITLMLQWLQTNYGKFYISHGKSTNAWDWISIFLTKWLLTFLNKLNIQQPPQPLFRSSKCEMRKINGHCLKRWWRVFTELSPNCYFWQCGYIEIFVPLWHSSQQDLRTQMKMIGSSYAGSCIWSTCQPPSYPWGKRHEIVEWGAGIAFAFWSRFQEPYQQFNEHGERINDWLFQETKKFFQE